MEKVYFRSIDNVKLAGVWHIPRDKTNKAVILAHGITVDKDEGGVFTNLANTLADNGIAVLRFDFRGHGESECKQVDFTISGQLKDLSAAVDEALGKGYKKIHLLAASFGGGATALFSAENPNKLESLCFWNPVLNYDHTFINPTLPWLNKEKERMYKDIKEKGWTTLGSHKYIIGNNIFEEMKKLKPYNALKKIQIPTLIIHGTKDTKVPYEDSKEYVKFLSRGKLVTIESAEHGFHKSRDYKEAEKETTRFFRG